MKLYSRNSDGTVNEWSIEVSSGKYRTIYGKLDGSKITSEWTVCSPKNVGKKNETSAERQAELEADALARKKKKSGYSESLSDIDTSTKFIEPMLAKQFSDYKDKIQYPVMIDVKLNGGRCITSSAGQYTRKGEAYRSIPHVWEKVSELFKDHPGLVLDGELYNFELRQKLNELMSLIRKQDPTPEELAKSESIVKYWVYDGYGFATKNGTYISESTPCNQRREAIIELLRDVVEENTYASTVVALPVNFAYSQQEVMDEYDKLVADGEEGIIIRDPSSAYQHKRTKSLLKLKPEDDAEFKIVDVVEGEGNRSGAAGKVVLEALNGQRFGASLKGTLAQFADVLSKKAHLIGKMAKIKFNGYTGLGTPNYAQFDCNNWSAEK